MNFDKKKVYKFGIIKAESQPTMPEFSPRYKSPAVSADHLLKSGIKDFNDYLIKNPHNFPTTKTVHCYIVDEDGNYQYFAEGNPFDIAAPKNVELSDDSEKTKLRSQGNQTMTIRDNSEVIKELKLQLQREQSRLEESTQECNALRNEIMSLKEKIIKFDGEKYRWKLEKDQLESVLRDYNERFKGMTGDSGFADRFRASLADQAGTILSNLIANPKLADLIVNIAGKIPYLRDMMTPVPQETTAPLADDANVDGFTTKEGEFDVNS